MVALAFSRAPQRARLLLVGLALGLLGACGGGGAGGSSSGGSANVAAALAPGAVVTFPTSAASVADANVAAITVGLGPGANVNIPYVTVRVCAPGSSTECRDIDNVLLDTGSTGLRLFADQLPANLLPPHAIGNSRDISECAQFYNTQAWGRVALADVQIGGERTTTAVPVQLMDAHFAPLPTDTCGSAPLLSTRTNTNAGAPPLTRALSANGILGVGLFAHDGQYYFDCATPDSSCLATASPNQQVQNPVSLFDVNNNGVVVQLPSIPATGAERAQGYLIFGVGTQANNQLGAANVVPVNRVGHFTTVYRGVSLYHSIMDSGSNGLYFNDPAPQVLGGSCTSASSDFYCPAAPRDLSASIQLASGAVDVAFSVASADSLLADRRNYAFNNLGGPLNGSSFDWGLPFFFGRSVYTVIEQRSVPGTSLNGPLHAFTD